MTKTIAFPNLGLKFNINPVAFEIFGWEIHWYGIIIALGLVLAVIVANSLAKKEGLPKDTILDVVLVSVPSAVAGARLYYVLFNLDYYLSNPSEIVKIWEGGLAIYGGIIGAVVASFIYCKVAKVSFRKVADVGAIGLLIGQTIGRWGNFVNGEAYGGPTDAVWKMDIYGKAMGVHPTFLYESVWNLLTLVILSLLYKKKRFDGEIFLSYITAYGIGRFMIEGLRADSLMLGGVRISQFVALACVITGLILLIKEYKKYAKKPSI